MLSSFVGAPPRWAAESPVRIFAHANSRFSRKRDPNGIILPKTEGSATGRLRRYENIALARMAAKPMGSNFRSRELAFFKKTRP
jgi:hypothetical protein